MNNSRLKCAAALALSASLTLPLTGCGLDSWMFWTNNTDSTRLFSDSLIVDRIGSIESDGRGDKDDLSHTEKPVSLKAPDPMVTPDYYLSYLAKLTTTLVDQSKYDIAYSYTGPKSNSLDDNLVPSDIRVVSFATPLKDSGILYSPEVISGIVDLASCQSSQILDETRKSIADSLPSSADQMLVSAASNSLTLTASGVDLFKFIQKPRRLAAGHDSIDRESLTVGQYRTALLNTKTVSAASVLSNFRLGISGAYPIIINPTDLQSQAVSTPFVSADSVRNLIHYGGRYTPEVPNAKPVSGCITGERGMFAYISGQSFTAMVAVTPKNGEVASISSIQLQSPFALVTKVGGDQNSIIRFPSNG